MTDQSESTATLRIFGESLEPSEIGTLLGAAAAESYKKGDALRGRSKDGGPRLAKQGMWRIEADRSQPASLDAQISDVLGRLTDDLAIWSNLDPTYEVDMFCGYFMSEGNEVIRLSPTTLHRLSERRVELVLDVYQPRSD